jgi:hypothetical protein
MISSAVWLTIIVYLHVECLYMDTVYSMEQLNIKNLYCTLLMNGWIQLYLCCVYSKMTHIKVNRLRWAGHVIRLEEQSPARRVLVAVVEGKRQRGKPKLRWEDGVMDDARTLGEKNWRNAARNKDGRRKLLRKAWAQIGLLHQ